jgi:hypothetical protein
VGPVGLALSSIAERFEVPILGQLRFDATSLKQCPSSRLNFSFQLAYVPSPSIRTRPSATCLFLCTSSHDVPPFEVLSSSHSTPRASARHDLVLHTLYTATQRLAFQIPYTPLVHFCMTKSARSSYFALLPRIIGNGAILADLPRYANGTTSKTWSVHTAAFLDEPTISG